MSNPQEEKQPSKAKWTRETWEAAMKDIQENQRLSRNPLTAKEMRAMRFTLNQDWEQAQQIGQLASRYGEMLDILYQRVHFLTHHLLGSVGTIGTARLERAQQMSERCGRTCLT